MAQGTDASKCQVVLKSFGCFRDFSILPCKRDLASLWACHLVLRFFVVQYGVPENPR